MDKYHVALSFAGEDRAYVKAVAESLQARGVRAFYDEFEDTNLWGKDLYTYLSDIYQNRAFYTVIFVSAAYRNKLWTNHERKAAQARAFSESREYILPAVFDKSVETPGVLKTTAYLDLKILTPQQFAEKILQKLRADKVFLSAEDKFAYSIEARADIDYPLSDGSEVTSILKALKSYNWYTQSPAIDTILSLNWADITPDQMFVLGRNIYQCGCGGERKATRLLRNLRAVLAKLPPNVATHLLNGIFYEVYFNAKGEFRGQPLKDGCLAELFSVQTVEKYKDSILFIRQALTPYRGSLAVLPSTTPEIIELAIKIAKKAPPTVKSVECAGEELLVDAAADSLAWARSWRLSFRKFTLKELTESISRSWNIPSKQLKLTTSTQLAEDAELRLPDGKMIGPPFK